MNRYYITYGSGSDMQFQKGWSVVYAESESEARQKHANRHGTTESGTLRFAFSYTEERFNATDMPTEGNLGGYEQEVIS